MPILLEDSKVCFFNVPKVASSSIKTAIYRIQTGRTFRKENHGGVNIHKLYKTKLPVTAEDYDGLEDFWKFTVVRDPVARLLSAYSNRVLYRRDMHKMPRARWRALRWRLSLTPGIDTFFAKLERYRGFSYSIREHTMPLSHYLGDDLARLDAVYRLEELGKLGEELSRRAGVPVELPHEQRGGPKLGLEAVSRRTYDILIAQTARDYEMLDGLYHPPAYPGARQAT